MADQVIDVSDFQFRALRRIRIFTKPQDTLYNGICPSWIAASSRYGIIICAASHDKLVSLRSSDVHRLRTTKADINAEVTDVQMKLTDLHFEKATVLVALACDCSGRLLSVLIETISGPFVYLYDVCAFSFDCPEQKGPMYKLRLSADADVKPCALEWNPQLDGVFAVATSDGVLSCYGFCFEESISMTSVGTTKLNDPITCMSWSPKGKQLAVGDVMGHIRHYKPEMTLVRTISAPTDATSLKSEVTTLRCVGLNWLTVTEFFVAYSPQKGREVTVALLFAKKGAPPQWTYFDDVNYCGNCSIFDQRIKFTQLPNWKVVLCSSLRSSEIAVLGKIGSEWKAWTLDDNGRIEMPLDAMQIESYPVGVAVDVSSVLPVKIDETETIHPPCPLVLVLSSHGTLLPYNALSFRADHQGSCRPPEALPSIIYGTTTQEHDFQKPESVKTVSESQMITSSLIPTNSCCSHVTSGNSSVTNQTMKQLQMQPKVNLSHPLQAVPIQIMHECLPHPNPPVSLSVSQQPQNLVEMEHRQEQRHHQGQRHSEFADDSVIEMRSELQRKVVFFEEQLFEMRQRNDWLQDLKCSTAKQLEGKLDISLDGDLSELCKIRAAVTSWIDGLENQIKESICSVKEQLDIANSTDRIQHHYGGVLDFNNMYRLNKLEESLARLEQKLSNIESAVADISTNDAQKRSALTLSLNEEQKIATTARNICKGMVSRRKTLCELQQQLTNLCAGFRSLKKEECLPKSSKTRKSFLNSSLSQQAPWKDLQKTTALNCIQQRKELLRSIIGNGSAKRFEAKVITFDVKSDVCGEKEMASLVTSIENRLLEAASVPTKTPAKLVMDVGTQSPDYFLSNEANKAYGEATSHITFTRSSTLLPALATDKLEANQTDQIQQLTNPATILPSSTGSFSLKNAYVPTTAAITSVSSLVFTSSTPVLSTINTVKEETASNFAEKLFPDVVPSFTLDATPAQKTSFSPNGTSNNADHTSSNVPVKAASSEGISMSVASISAASAVTEANKSSVLSPEILPNLEFSVESTKASVLDGVPTTTAVEKTVSFTFKLPAPVKQQASSATNGKIDDSANVSLQPASADLDSIGDEGVMEAEGTLAAPTRLFSSSLTFGYKNAGQDLNVAQNLFGAGLKFDTSKVQTPFLFGRAADSKSSSVFGGGTAVGGGTGIFSHSQQSSAASSPSFSFTSALSNPQSASNVFGAKPGASAGTKFGGAPTFGSKPVFGSPSPLVSAFGQQRGQQTPTAFSAFAKSGAVGFGALAAGQQQQQQSSSSVFGGGGFGALGQQSQKSSIFGGGLNSSTTSSSSFSTWR